MEKITAKIDRFALIDALILWNTGVDGEDGGTCNITDEIPWESKWEKFMTWTEANEKWLDSAIGSRDSSVMDMEADAILKMLLTSHHGINTNNIAVIGTQVEKITKWAKERADQIIKAYEIVIAELNNRIEESQKVYGIVEKTTGVDSRGYVTYEKVVVIEGKTNREVAKRLYQIGYGIYPNTWAEGSFVANVVDGWNLHIGGVYYCHLGNKVTHS